MIEFDKEEFMYAPEVQNVQTIAWLHTILVILINLFNLEGE